MKKSRVVLLIAILVVLSWLLYFRPTKVEAEIPLAEVTYGGNTIKSESFIHFSGYKYRHLLKKSYFEGSVQIGETSFDLARVNLNHFDTLMGVDPISGDSIGYASTYLSSFFDEITLLVFH